MKILATADLHGHLPQVPKCDLLIVAGDVTPQTSHAWDDQHAWLNGPFRRWCAEAPARQIVLVAGNHDFIFARTPRIIDDLLIRSKYLQDESFDFEGVSIYGVPWVPKIADWAFEASLPELERRYAMVPEGTNIIVSHGPPLGYGDFAWNRRAGARAANQAIDRVRPKAFINGHIHEGYGSYSYRCPDGHFVDVYNCSYVDERYRVRSENGFAQIAMS